MLESAQAEAIAETWLFETWAARERASFALPPSLLAVEPADIVRVDDDGDGRLFRVTEIGEHGARDIEARSVDPDVYGGSSGTERPTRPDAPVITGQPLVEFIDLPLLRGDEPPAAGYVGGDASAVARQRGRVRFAGDDRLRAEGPGDGAGDGRRDARRLARAGRRGASITARVSTVKVEGEALTLVHAAATPGRAQRRGAAQRRRRVGGRSSSRRRR